MMMGRQGRAIQTPPVLAQRSLTEGAPEAEAWLGIHRWAGGLGPAGATTARCRLYTHRSGSTSAWAGIRECAAKYKLVGHS